MVVAHQEDDLGHGASRELGGDDAPLKDLPGDLAERLEVALKRLDQIDPEFGQSRVDERHQQLSGAWNDRCLQIVADLRQIGLVIVSTHQVLTDMSQDGAGIGATPWIEEGGMKLDRLCIRNHSGPVRAECGETIILEAASLEEVDYDWLERAVVEWIIFSVGNKR